MTNQGIAISMVYPIMKSIVHKGYDVEQYFRYASFDSSLLQDVEARITGEQLERLMIAAATFTQDEHFGLRQGQITEFADMGILGYVMLHSGTIADALAAYQRYNVILCSGFNLDWEARGEDIVIRMFLQHPGRMSRHCVEDMASSLCRIMMRLSNRTVPLHEVRFTHDAPVDTTPYAEAFGTVPRFGGDENHLRMSKDVLNYPVMYSDPKLLGVFEAIAQETKMGLTRESDFSDQVVRWLKQCLPSFLPTLQQTAESFGMSTRTIQNRLKEEDTTYIDLATRVRKEMAMGYLKKKEYSVGEIAYVLHFSEPSAFQSAFKKWTGLTPGQYRANAKHQHAEASH
ncbi:AraC family transcriptional regulator [Cohnella mopanensis]|uniref:AraC family transcriptional regulator n=1 Tax=Cohnella mopanensis TaxID=2911966 RepID=UPI001EF7CE8A|nr:AraC family transcriptional regulator [Cohnella mopanensis]